MSADREDQLRQYLTHALRGRGGVDLSWARPRASWQYQAPWLYEASYSDPSATAEEVARALYADAEFRALELGSWLNTPDGELISAAVMSVLPYPYRQEAKILIEALRLAATWQRNRRLATAALLGGAIGVVGLAIRAPR